MLLKTFRKGLVGLSFLVCASVFAAPVTVDFSNIESHGLLGDWDNVVRTVDVGANATITGISYDISMTAFEPSYLSEMAVAIETSDSLAGVYFTPANGQDNPGSANVSGSADLLELGLAFQVGADGLLRFEFFETFDDFWGVADGLWNFASFTFDVVPADDPAPVPEPASALLLAAGLATMRYAGRRAAKKSAAAFQ